MIRANPVAAPEWSLSELADKLADTGTPWSTPIWYASLAAKERASPAVCENPSSIRATAATATVPACSPTE